jgi:hypothetical protein
VLKCAFTSATDAIFINWALSADKGEVRDGKVNRPPVF